MHQLISYQDNHQEPAEIPRALIASSNRLLSKTLILGSHDAVRPGTDILRDKLHGGMRYYD